MTDYQGTFNGLTFGPGTDVQLSSLDGFRSLPGIRSLDIPKSRQNGAWAGLDYLDERIFIANLEVVGPVGSVATFEEVVSGIADACQLISDPTLQKPFAFTSPGWTEPRQIWCRPTKGGVTINREFSQYKTPVPIEFTASDPLLYSTTKHSASAGLPSPTAGLTFPVTFNVTFGSSTGGSMTVENAGNYITAPVFTIVGPVTNPTITFSATGQFMTLAITLTASDTIVIDMGARTVTLNGTANRYNTITTGSSWFGIPPGIWSIGVASTDSAAVAAVFTTEWYDAWGWA